MSYRCPREFCRKILELAADSSVIAIICPTIPTAAGCGAGRRLGLARQTRRGFPDRLSAGCDRRVGRSPR